MIILETSTFDPEIHFCRLFDITGYKKQGTIQLALTAEVGGDDGQTPCINAKVRLGSSTYVRVGMMVTHEDQDKAIAERDRIFRGLTSRKLPLFLEKIGIKSILDKVEEDTD